MFRFIVFLIFILLAAKLFGAVIKVLRDIFAPPRPQPPHAHAPSPPAAQKYDNVQDADFEEIGDKK